MKTLELRRRRKERDRKTVVTFIEHNKSDFMLDALYAFKITEGAEPEQVGVIILILHIL